jgi:hypothetical protein
VYSHGRGEGGGAEDGGGLHSVGHGHGEIGIGGGKGLEGVGGGVVGGRGGGGGGLRVGSRGGDAREEGIAMGREGGWGVDKEKAGAMGRDEQHRGGGGGGYGAPQQYGAPQPALLASRANSVTAVTAERLAAPPAWLLVGLMFTYILLCIHIYIAMYLHV